MPARFTTVDEYIASFPEDVRAVLEKVRETIRKAAPEAEERIGYQMPAYRLHRPLVYFAAWKDHWALYPATGTLVEAFAEELRPYEVAKGTIKFPYGRPVPVRLVRALVKHRVAENIEAATAKAAARAARKPAVPSTAKRAK
ncbi:MAG: DUF1801 domain-containing protein [Dehalococcoidia bacterium]|nr:MAG: DUF1801 domain-containing protein [Dehalococcoidia bacterium]